jgi:hypothetical protein
VLPRWAHAELEEGPLEVGVEIDTGILPTKLGELRNLPKPPDPLHN